MFLRLIELFESVQGETSFAGLPTTFIRLAACNLRCTWCDTTYSFKKGDRVLLEEVISQTEKYGHKHVCITGGEPLLQESVYPLMHHLADKFVVSLETSGSLPIDKVDPRVHIILDIKCPQSGMADKNHFENLSRLLAKDEVKFVIQDRGDFDYALAICERFSLFDKAPVLFSPVFGLLDPKLLTEWILENKCPVRLNLQLHKFIWEPTKQGV